MRTIVLADTGRGTTQLGYGCSSVMGAAGRRASLRWLDAALDAGMRHFDVAPLYGYGEAESCVGEFLARAGADVTVATKFGIPAPRRGGLLRAARRLTQPVLQRAPGMRRKLARATTSVTTPAHASFTAAAARQSLESSLRALRRDRIDVWLLHEPRVEDLVHDELLRWMDESVAQGKIGSFGVASARGEAERLLREKPAYCRAVQTDWSVLEPADAEGGVFRIHHRTLSDRFPSLHRALSADAGLAARWSAEVGVDLRDRATLAALMLKAALELHAESLTLVSSRNPEHLRANVRTAEDESLALPARKLYALLQSEDSSVTMPTLRAGR